MTPPPSCRPLEWDRLHWGRPVFGVSVHQPEDVAEATSFLLSVPGCLAFLDLPATDLGLVRSAEHHGFRTMDVRVTFGRPLREDEPWPGTVRESTTADLTALSALAAAAYRHSRFREDARLTHERVDDLYASWVRNAHTDPVSVVLVAEGSDGIDGFVTCRRPDDGPAVIGLIGTAGHARGRGVGQALLAAAAAHATRTGAPELRVGTSSPNTGAQAFYQRCGFSLVGMGVAMHWWHPEETPPAS